uniref:Uncharacterized protein n=1 Tax=Arundo donax TaxID=35708 RepID=A0A0A8Y3Q5_ARUDO
MVTLSEILGYGQLNYP